KIKNHGLVMALCNPCLEKYNIEIVEINDFLKSCGNCGYRQLEIHIEPCSACNQCDKWEREEYTNDTSDSSC
ncbi:MAG: hypothetical protein GY853_15710, partial [PVC group bacterium]|nr:hypothetical protein [PVC group bacterium]